MSEMRPNPDVEHLDVPIQFLTKFEAAPRFVFYNPRGGMKLSREMLERLSVKDLVQLTETNDILVVAKAGR